MKIGILAYGSLVYDPGEEILAVLEERRGGVKTPFPIEFARASAKRGGGPTLVPVRSGGASVNAVVLVLNERLSEANATNMLYCREIGHVGSGRRYRPDANNPDQVHIERLEDTFGCDVTLYTRIEPNIQPLIGSELARRSIASARGERGAQAADGISYLRRAVENGIESPLTAEYVAEILKQTGTSDLERAWQEVRSGAV